MQKTELYFAVTDKNSLERIPTEQGQSIAWGGLKDMVNPDWLVEDGCFTLYGVLLQMSDDRVETLVD